MHFHTSTMKTVAKHS